MSKRGVSFCLTRFPFPLDRTLDTLLQANFSNSAVQYTEEYLPHVWGILPSSLAHKPAYLAKTRLKPGFAFTLLPYIRPPLPVPLTPKASGKDPVSTRYRSNSPVALHKQREMKNGTSRERPKWAEMMETSGAERPLRRTERNCRTAVADASPKTSCPAVTKEQAGHKMNRKWVPKWNYFSRSAACVFWGEENSMIAFINRNLIIESLI